MFERPRLKSFLTVFPISEDTWGLRGGSDEIWRLKLGARDAMRTFTALLPHLDGRQTTDEILARLAEQEVAPEAARHVLERLADAALIEEADDAGLTEREIDTFRDQITMFSRFSKTGGARHQRLLRRSHVAVVGSGRLSASVERQLAQVGFGRITRLVEDTDAEDRAANSATTETDGLTEIAQRPLDRLAIWPSEEQTPDLLFVPQQRHDSELLEAVDAYSKRREAPWMLLRTLDVREGWVGPLFIPGETADYLSLEARLRGNLPFYDESRAFDRKVRCSGQPGNPLGGLYPHFDVLAGIAAVEAIKLVTNIRTPDLAGKFLTIDPWRWELELHEVLKVPWVDHGLSASPTPLPWKEDTADDSTNRIAG